MYSLFFGIFLVVVSLRDLIDAKGDILPANTKDLTDAKRRAYRRWRGSLLFLMALAAGWVWYVEIILRKTVFFPEALLVFGLPYAIPMVGVVILNKVYGVSFIPKA